MLKTAAQRKINRTGALWHYTATAVKHKVTLQKWWQDVCWWKYILLILVLWDVTLCHWVSGCQCFIFLRLHLTFQDEHTKTSKLILSVTWRHIPQSSATWMTTPNLRKHFHKLWYCNDQMQLSVTGIFFFFANHVTSFLMMLCLLTIYELVYNVYIKQNWE